MHMRATEVRNIIIDPNESNMNPDKIGPKEKPIIRNSAMLKYSVKIGQEKNVTSFRLLRLGKGQR